MEVSIVIINYNTFQLTCSCIESVIQKTTDLEYEIILVDNASTEIDPKNFLAKFPSVILVESNMNDGFAKGNNRGILVAKGKYILLLNSDTILKNNAVAICFHFLENNHHVAVVGARLENPDGTHQCNCQRLPSIKYGMLEFLRIQKFTSYQWGGKVLLGFFFDHKSVIYPDWVWGTFFMFRKSILEKFPNGRLHDDYFMYVEDMQWCFEFRKRGYEIAFEPNAVAIHLNGQSKGNKPKMMRDNTELFMIQYYNPVSRFFIKVLNLLLTGNYAYY